MWTKIKTAKSFLVNIFSITYNQNLFSTFENQTRRKHSNATSPVFPLHAWTWKGGGGGAIIIHTKLSRTGLIFVSELAHVWALFKRVPLQLNKLRGGASHRDRIPNRDMDLSAVSAFRPPMELIKSPVQWVAQRRLFSWGLSGCSLKLTTHLILLLTLRIRRPNISVHW
jgi:hypothetical protein